jgi:hypothetical protein
MTTGELHKRYKEVMKIAIIGAGRVGGNLARQFANKGHEVALAFSQDEQRLQDLAHI